MNIIRIAGVNVDGSKAFHVALRSIFGINKSTALKICMQCSLDPITKGTDLSDSQLEEVRKCVRSYKIEGDLRRDIHNHLRRLVEIKCYRGRRRQMGLPARGQRTRSNGKTAKKLKLR